LNHLYKAESIEIKEKVNEIEFKEFYDSIFLVSEMEKYYLEGFEDLREQLMANKF